jgi:hypothetical protein
MPQQNTSSVPLPAVERVETFTVTLTDGSIVTRSARQLTRLAPGHVSDLVRTVSQ